MRLVWSLVIPFIKWPKSVFLLSLFTLKMYLKSSEDRQRYSLVKYVIISCSMLSPVSTLFDLLSWAARWSLARRSRWSRVYHVIFVWSFHRILTFSSILRCIYARNSRLFVAEITCPIDHTTCQWRFASSFRGVTSYWLSATLKPVFSGQCAIEIFFTSN